MWTTNSTLQCQFFFFYSSGQFWLMNTKAFFNSTLLGPCTLYHWHTKVLSSWVVAILKHMCFGYTSTCKSKDTMVERCKESKRERQRKWEVEEVGERTIINSKERGREKKRKRQREGESVRLDKRENNSKH